MPLIDGVIVTKIYDFIILPIIHTTLLLRSNKLWKRKNQIYVTTLYLMNFLYNQKLVRNWYLNNSKIILEVKDLGQLWRIFKHLACYYFSTQFGVENRRAIILRNVRVENRRAMNIKTRKTQISCFNAFGSWDLSNYIFWKAQRPYENPILKSLSPLYLLLMQQVIWDC